MKIAFVSYHITKTDGQGKVNFELAKHALKNGHQVFLVANEIDDDLIRLGAIFYKVKNLKFPDLIRVSSFTLNANKIIKKIKADYIIANGFSTTLPHDINIAHFVHDGWLKSKYYPYKNLWHIYYLVYTLLNSWWEKIAFKQAKKIIAVSDLIKKQLIATGTPENKITVIYNGVDCKEFKPIKNKKINKILTAIFVGDIKSSRKNFGSILLAIQKIPKIKLIVVGSIKGSPYPEMASRLNLSKRINFVGFQNDTCSFLYQADFFILPAKYDPCPLVLMEAMASALPVVASNQVGNSCLIKNNGVIINNPDSISQISKAIKFLLDQNQKSLINMGNNSRIIAIKYDWKKVCEKYFNFIKI